MKKLLITAAAVLLTVVACNDKGNAEQQLRQQRDSLNSIIAQRDNAINDMMGTLNEIQEGFREINEAENKLSIARSGDGAGKASLIRENIKFIAQRMQENRNLIAKMKSQLAASKLNAKEMAKTIENMISQLEEKEQQMQQLRAELDAKNIHISELDETINNLNSNVKNQRNELSQKTQTISNQDRQLNTAWYVYGTKSELKEKKILEHGKVLQGNFDKNYFTKIDIRVTREVKLYSKSAKLLTTHPSSSYTLEQDENKQYVLRITNPQLFWSTSKYLVIQVK